MSLTHSIAKAECLSKALLTICHKFNETDTKLNVPSLLHELYVQVNQLIINKYLHLCDADIQTEVEQDLIRLLKNSAKLNSLKCDFIRSISVIFGDDDLILQPSTSDCVLGYVRTLNNLFACALHELNVGSLVDHLCLLTYKLVNQTDDVVSLIDLFLKLDDEAQDRFLGVVFDFGSVSELDLRVRSSNCLNVCVHFNKLTNYVHKDEYWEVILNGLISNERVDRNNGLHLLTKSIEFLLKSNSDVLTNYFVWDAKNSKDLATFWKSYIVFLETLNEVQVHLINASFSLAEKAFERFYGSSGISSWGTVLFHRILTHESLAVVRWGLMHLPLTNKRISNWPLSTKCVFSVICSALNTLMLYTRQIDVEQGHLKYSSTDIEIVLFKWFEPSDDPDDSELTIKLLRNLINCICTINWSPVPLFSVLQPLSSIPSTECLEGVDHEHLKSLITVTTRTHSPLIRREIHHLVLGIAVKHSKRDEISNILTILDGFPVESLYLSKHIVLASESLSKTFNLEQLLKSRLLTSCSPFILLVKPSDPSVLFKCIEELAIKIKISGNKDDVRHLIKILKMVNTALDCTPDLKNLLEADSFRELLLSDPYLAFEFFDVANNSASNNDTDMKLVELCTSDFEPFLNFEQCSLLKIFWWLAKCRNNADLCLSFIERLHQFDCVIRNSRLDNSKLYSECLRVYWNILELALNYNFGFKSSKVCPSEIVRFGTHCVEIMETHVDIMSAVKVVLSFCEDKKLVDSFLEATFNSCFDKRRSSFFKASVELWISVAFQDKLFEHHSDLLNSLGKRLLNIENNVGLACFLMRQLHKNVLCNHHLIWDLIIEGTLYGPPVPKDTKIEFDTCKYIQSLNKLPTSHNFEIRDNSEVRIRAIDIIQQLSENPNNANLIVSTVQKLIARDQAMSEECPRYYLNSLHHKIKNRILQTILIIEEMVYRKQIVCYRDISKELISWATCCLLNNSNQTSVRYQLEWLCVRLLVHSPSCLDEYWACFDKASRSAKMSSVCSFITIGYHMLKMNHDEEMFKQFFDLTFPWCMGQNFTARLYSQVTLRLLWEHFEDFSTQYSRIWKNIDLCYSQGNVYQNVKKIEDDFYFSVFQPMNHLKVLFWDFPRLTKVGMDEWVSANDIKIWAPGIYELLSLDISDLPLASCETMIWDTRGPEMTDCDVDAEGIQKKYIPPTDLFEPSLTGHRQLTHNDLILVASLIDKIANLGGLARTCEVFSVNELVLSRLELVSNKEFTSLSMTAEKHIKISEVKSFNLLNYLNKMKILGYSIIGIEQTSNSVCLTEFKFPKKSVLVLGNEKKGIPAELLRAIDVCVQVPQSGLIRSLNVHVTGALCVWEYYKQHNF